MKFRSMVRPLLACATALVFGALMSARAQNEPAAPPPPVSVPAPDAAAAPAPPPAPEIFNVAGLRQGALQIMGDSEHEGWLGVEVDEVTAENAKEFKLPSERGVVVKSVEADSPAAKAGLKADDVILRYRGEDVEGVEQFERLVRETPPGRAVTLSVWRSGRAENLDAELGNRGQIFDRQMHGAMQQMHNSMRQLQNMRMNMRGPDFFNVVYAARTPLLGIQAEDLSGQLGKYFGAPDGQGVLVREVEPNSAAAKAGLEAGDVIVNANGKPVHSLDDLRGQLRPAGDKSVTLSLGVIRRGARKTLSATIEPPPRIEMRHAERMGQL